MAVPTGVTVAGAELAIVIGVAVILAGARGLATSADVTLALLGVLFLAHQVAWPLAHRERSGR